jgi:hypothetical protein
VVDSARQGSHVAVAFLDLDQFTAACTSASR